MHDQAGGCPPGWPGPWRVSSGGPSPAQGSLRVPVRVPYPYGQSFLVRLVVDDDESSSEGRGSFYKTILTETEPGREMTVSFRVKVAIGINVASGPLPVPVPPALRAGVQR